MTGTYVVKRIGGLSANGDPIHQDIGNLITIMRCDGK